MSTTVLDNILHVYRALHSATCSRSNEPVREGINYVMLPPLNVGKKTSVYPSIQGVHGEYIQGYDVYTREGSYVQADVLSLNVEYSLPR